MRMAVLVAAAALLGAVLLTSAADARSRSSHSSRSHGGTSRGSSAGDAGTCTRSSPCTGPRGGTYYYTPGGSKQYLPR